MKHFFDQKVGFGRYPDKTVREVFSRNRPYFDQILYKNVQFRRLYAEAFQAWADKVGENPDKLRTERIMLAVELMGEQQVKSLFGQLVEYINEKYPQQILPQDLDFRGTIPQGQAEMEDEGKQILQINVFWERLAIPEVWQEE